MWRVIPADVHGQSRIEICKVQIRVKFLRTRLGILCDRRSNLSLPGYCSFMLGSAIATYVTISDLYTFTTIALSNQSLIPVVVIEGSISQRIQRRIAR